MQRRKQKRATDSLNLFQEIEPAFEIPWFHHADMINILLNGKIMGVTSPTDATLNCTFLSGFTGSDHCAVQYGNDPTYMNMPYSAESTETGTAGDSVSVVLRERLNSTTVYYYTMSAVSGDITVIVQGTFTTPQYSKCICYERNTYLVALLPKFACLLRLLASQVVS